MDLSARKCGVQGTYLRTASYALNPVVLNPVVRESGLDDWINYPWQLKGERKLGEAIPEEKSCKNNT